MEENKNYGNQIIGGIGNNIIGDIKPVLPMQSESADSLTAWKDIALNHIGRGELKEALHEYIKNSTKADTKNQAIQLLGRLSYVEDAKISGTLSREEELVEVNSIRNAIVLLISSL